MKSLNSACAASLLEQGMGNCLGNETERNGLLDSPCSTTSSLSSLTPPATPFNKHTTPSLATLHPQSSLLLRQLSEPSTPLVSNGGGAGNDYGCVLLDAGREYIALGELNYSGQGAQQAAAGGAVQANEMDFLENISGFGYAAGTSGSYNGYGNGSSSYTVAGSAAAAGAGAGAAAAASAASHANGALNYLGTPGKAAADIDPKEIDQYLMDQMLPMTHQTHPHAQHLPAQSSPPLNSSASLSSACSSASSQPVECLAASPNAYYNEHMGYPTQAQSSAGYTTAHAAQQYVADATEQQHQQQHQQHHHLWSTYVNP